MWRFQQLQATHAIDCIVSFMNRLDRKRLTLCPLLQRTAVWCGHCFVWYCNVLQCRIRPWGCGKPSASWLGGRCCRQFIYTLFIEIWGGLALAAQTHMQADWTGLYNMRNTVFATAGKAREVNVFWTALVRKRTRKSINTSSQKIRDTRPRYRLWLWMSCPKRWKLRHGLLDVAFPAASINTCNWLHCIFHESTGQEEVDPLSIAAEDSRLTWALFCVVLQCIAV